MHPNQASFNSAKGNKNSLFEKLLNIDSQKMISSLKKITPPIDNNNPKFELNGALIDISSNKISIASTDNKSLALVKNENNSTEENSLIIPKKTQIKKQKLSSVIF